MDDFLTITKPDSACVRDGSKSPRGTLCEQFDRALIMPNLTPPVRTAEEAGDVSKVDHRGGERDERAF